MADAPKTVRGTLSGVTVQTTEETAQALGSSFEPEEKTAAKKAAAAKKSDSK